MVGVASLGLAQLKNEYHKTSLATHEASIRVQVLFLRLLPLSWTCRVLHVV